jgi:hypothetical protein
VSCKVRIDAPHGIVEIEGDAEFVASFYEKLAPLVDRAHFGTAVRAEEAPTGGEPDPMGDDGESTEVGKPKRKKRTAQRPPSGQGCRDRILKLKEAKFFAEKKSASDIVVGLGKNGFTHNVSQVGAALTAMFNKGEIQRTKDGGGNWQFFWDRG